MSSPLQNDVILILSDIEADGELSHSEFCTSNVQSDPAARSISDGTCHASTSHGQSSNLDLEFGKLKILPTYDVSRKNYRKKKYS